VSRIAFAASSSAYGDSETLPKIESMPAAARSPYAANKVACESLMSAYARQLRAGYRLAALFQHLRPAAKRDNAYAAVIAAFAKALLAGHGRRSLVTVSSRAISRTSTTLFMRICSRLNRRNPSTAP